MEPVSPFRNKQSAVIRWRVCDERGRTSAPLVTTKFITQDQNQGYSGQCFMHSSMSHFPVNTDMIKQSTVLSELIVSHVRAVEKELVHPIVNFGELGPIRCTAYMLPGTYDIVITKDYCRNNSPSKVLAMVFVIDNKVKSGLVQLQCTEFKNNIRHLPVDEGQERASIKVHEASSLTVPDGGRRRCPGNVHALLFTSCSDQRQLRVFNLSLETCNQLVDIFRSSDLDTTNLFFAKQGLFKLQDNKA
ncbi:Sec24B protein [Culex quinquefasciatus]|uniref:Sec24B protein n=1 Tax=Culex quinquefasciatus TaxID=7176 RepID=B0XFF1_CULQU|nr:Sec24B protein [Culex quinquefasciatus]|eukprot:XP_001868373.1 Sec24B protein [Culex quinquefasciatus]